MTRTDLRPKPGQIFRWREYLVDAGIWTIALPIATLIRMDFDATAISPLVVAVAVLLAVTLQALSGWAFGLYRYLHPYGSRYDAVNLMLVVGSVGLVLTVGRLLVPASDDFPRSSPLIGLLVAFVLMAGARLVHRTYCDRRLRPGESATPTLVYGAGHLGQHVIQQMNRDRYSPFRPVGIIDDDPRLRNFHLEGVPVLGGRDQLAQVAHDTGAEVLIFAIARAEAELLRQVSDDADAAGLRLLVLPLLADILEGHTRLNDLRDVSISDLIGRHAVDTELDSIAGFITNKRILVTGAGGSIGSELCREVMRFSPAEVIMLDRDETGLQGTQISISGHGLLDTEEVVLADIRDEKTIQDIFLKRRPEVVFHAAALKHLPMLEQYPNEAWQTNVLGTLNVLRAARAADVETFVNISTDKAANPTSVLGYSKRLGERLTAWFAADTKKTYLSVRFGNVIGSRGSMLPTFRLQIEAGGPLTLTHPEVTRYFMTIPEACQLVVQAGAIGCPGEALILDMGEPVRIMDVAQRMIAKSGRKISISITGLRQGEKLHEELVGAGETDERPIHPKISHTGVPPLSPSELLLNHWGPANSQVRNGLQAAQSLESLQ
ncbi:FlaA1/EpsC-like NDP-sugar epimerase [Pseudarthrobacter siccitolerans]|uniref:FlaA1/EpsC-like NDP-sugar epimerase n=1 Tax=Pseudarthrobacter siccitolerans TaxID=861266 RepID=A0ABU0PL14_9MICC|nr:nucleoside-diphosphate sugar epimerase/dehydratase [Pseudarthrobacter siccitolerans]MDQ0673956.1 FlaA1/EpsC-like NDP-sugar epimerase [Pseudarthrobacter siccitolerans]